MGNGRPNIFLPEDRLKLFPYATRKSPQPVPTEALCDAPLVCVRFNAQWAAHVSGCLEALIWPDAWEGTDEEKERAIDTINEVIDMLNCFCGDDGVINNYYVNSLTYQQMLISIYDGDLHNVDPDSPATDFNSDGGSDPHAQAHRDAALCAACKALIDILCAQALERLGFATLISSIIAGLSAFGGVPGLIIGFIAGAAIQLLGVLGREVLEDEHARELVACCMYENLKGTPNTAQNLANSLDGCESLGYTNADLIVGAIPPADLGSHGNWLAFNKLLGHFVRFSEAEILDPCVCECVTYDWNWFADPLLTTADWTELTLAEFPIGPNTTNNPFTLGYSFDLGAASGANYIIGEGYSNGSTPYTPTGGKVSVDNNGCLLTEVAITISQDLSTHSSGVNVWALAGGAWTFIGGTLGFGPTQQRRNVTAALADVTAVAIIANSENTNYIGRVEINFG